MKTIYDFSVKDRKGKDVSLKEYANEVLLIVNTATKCGFTPQYEAHNGIVRSVQSYFHCETNEEYAGFGIPNCDVVEYTWED